MFSFFLFTTGDVIFTFSLNLKPEEHSSEKFVAYYCTVLQLSAHPMNVAGSKQTGTTIHKVPVLVKYTDCISVES